jgi:hypothetical protein
MKYIQVLLAVVVLTFASGAIQSARAGEDPDPDSPSVTLYTSVLRGDDFHCNAANVSDDKTLDIVFTIFDVNGDPLPAPGNPSLPLPTPPGAVACAGCDITVSPPNNGYCKVQVFGTRNRNDVRVQLNITLTRTIPGTDTPVFVFRTVEGH